MGLKFYVDHNVHGDITEGMRKRLIDVLTCAEDGTAQAADEDVLQRATDLGRVMFSQDDDFLRLTTFWLRRGQTFAGLVFAHQRGVTIGEALRDLELISEAMTEDEMRDRVWLLPI
jgi:hypothetical protein